MGFTPVAVVLPGFCTGAAPGGGATVFVAGAKGLFTVGAAGGAGFIVLPERIVPGLPVGNPPAGVIMARDGSVPNNPVGFRFAPPLGTGEDAI
jgi:hypothetical protein